MNEDAIADLKQFIAATISQQLTSSLGEIKTDISEIKTDLKRLEQKVDKLEARSDKLEEWAEEADIKLGTIANTIGARIEKDQAKTNTRLDDHEVRIIKLEPQAA